MPVIRHTLAVLTPLLLCLSLFSVQAAEIENKAQLGQLLFFDPSLSLNRSQSCASCHSPQQAFSDPGNNPAKGSVSLGDDGASLGDRNAPTAGYASYSPPFHRNKQGQYIGGQFWDGRAATLTDQAAGPPLNPIEMAMTDESLVAERLRENPSYTDAIERFFGHNTLNNDKKIYRAMAKSIAAFEETKAFSPFDSKYDRYLQGEYQPTQQEELGMTLFFSQQFTNCNLCHQLKSRPMAAKETFTDYSYHNIGVPVNAKVRTLNQLGVQQDLGLFHNPAVDDPGQKGKFKVPTLRNIAITGPYMHNGVFSDLRTVVLFYNKYNSRSAKRQINPETGEQWLSPEVPENLSLTELETGPALDDRRVDALVAFLKMLTDKRYESLLH